MTQPHRSKTLYPHATKCNKTVRLTYQIAWTSKVPRLTCNASPEKWAEWNRIVEHRLNIFLWIRDAAKAKYRMSHDEAEAIISAGYERPTRRDHG